MFFDFFVLTVFSKSSFHWEKVQLNTSLGKRSGAQMVYCHGRILIFGGICFGNSKKLTSNITSLYGVIFCYFNDWGDIWNIINNKLIDFDYKTIFGRQRKDEIMIGNESIEY